MVSTIHQHESTICLLTVSLLECEPYNIYFNTVHREVKCIYGRKSIIMLFFTELDFYKHIIVYSNSYLILSHS